MTKLSKRAFSIGESLGLEQESNVRKYLDTVWVPSKGFFENLFSVAIYISPFIGGGTGRFIPLILAGLGSYLLGLGPSELGRAIDRFLGTGPGVAPSSDAPDRIERLLESAIGQRQQELSSTAQPISKRQMEKTAGVFSALLKSGKIASMVASFIKQAIIAILGVYGIASIDGFVKRMTAPIRERTTGKPEGFFGEEDGITPEQKPNNLNTLLEDLEQKYGISQTEE